MDYPAKVNDLEIALWEFKHVQNITGSTIKTFQLKNEHKPSCKSEFVVVGVIVVVIVVADITCVEYFLSVFLSSFFKIFENLWKWCEFIYYSFLVNNMCLNFAFICTCHWKWVFAANMHIVYLCGIAGIWEVWGVQC